MTKKEMLQSQIATTEASIKMMEAQKYGAKENQIARIEDVITDLEEKCQQLQKELNKINS